MRVGLVILLLALAAVGVALVTSGGTGMGTGTEPAAGGAAPQTDPTPGGASALTPAIPPASGDLFVESAARMGLDFVFTVGDGKMDNILESVGAGGVCFDYDGDGDLDVYLVSQGYRTGISTGPNPGSSTPNRLFRNLGSGRFEDVTAAAGVGDTSFSFGAVAADIDGDGRIDLYVLNCGRNRLYHNLGQGRFREEAAPRGIADGACSVAATFLDADEDGDFDLYVGNYLTYDPAYRLHYAPDRFPGPLAFAAEADVYYENTGAGQFRVATQGSGLDVAPARAMGIVAFDADADGHLDLYVTNDASANFFFRGLGGGRFAEVGTENGTAYGASGEDTAAMAAAVGDANGDGRPDLFVSDTAFGALYQNDGHGGFRDRARASGVATLMAPWANWGGGWLDMDADGDLDLFAASGDLHFPTGRPDLLLENRGDGTFVDARVRGGRVFDAECLSRGGIIADLDEDGDLDIIVTPIGDRALVLENRGVAGHHILTVDLQAERDPRAAGRTRVRVQAGDLIQTRVLHLRTGYLTQGDARLHFGLGSLDHADRVEILHPDGSRKVFENVPAGRVFRPASTGGPVR